MCGGVYWNAYVKTSGGDLRSTNLAQEDVEKFQDRIRARLGLGYAFSEKWTAEFEVTFQISRNVEPKDL